METGVHTSPEDRNGHDGAKGLEDRQTSSRAGPLAIADRVALRLVIEDTDPATREELLEYSNGGADDMGGGGPYQAV